MKHYGLSKTTMADIAREASVGVGTVYLEFDSKNEIIKALAEERHQRVLEELRDACKAGRRYEDRIKGFLETRYQMFVKLAESGAHAAELVHCASEGVAQAWKRYEAEERVLLVELLERGVDEEELDVEDAELTATAIFRVYASFAPPYLYRENDCGMKLLQEVHHLMLRGLLKR